MADYQIAELPLEGGTIGIAGIPGRSGAYQHDLSTILRWKAGMVLTMTEAQELTFADAGSLGDDLADAGVEWRHLPISNMGAPPAGVQALWPEVSAMAHRLLREGGRVLAHCYGGCGRSGMALLRLMVEAGEAPEAALARLRGARPCAVETGEQFDWAAEGWRDA